MTALYILRRVAIFLLVVWAAATLNFFLPRLARGRDPVREKLGQLAATGGLEQSGIEEMVRAYQARFGLDRPLFLQYLSYLADMARFDLGVSLSSYPARVSELILAALPWTLSLLVVSTLLAFAAGTLLGAASGWPRSPRALAWLMAPSVALSAVPYYLLGLVLAYVFGLALGVLPVSGGHSAGAAVGFSLEFALDAARHAALPALSVVLSATGFWAVTMRGCVVMVSGEPHVEYAEALGLPPRTIFFRHVLRNALLPQTTSLALSLGQVVSGSMVVEAVFAYPGMGSLLFRAIAVSDYPLIHGIVFLVIVAVAGATLVLDLVYPLLDPRVARERGV